MSQSSTRLSPDDRISLATRSTPRTTETKASSRLCQLLIATATLVPHRAISPVAEVGLPVVPAASNPPA